MMGRPSVRSGFAVRYIAEDAEVSEVAEGVCDSRSRASWAGTALVSCAHGVDPNVAETLARAILDVTVSRVRVGSGCSSDAGARSARAACDPRTRVVAILRDLRDLRALRVDAGVHAGNAPATETLDRPVFPRAVVDRRELAVDMTHAQTAETPA